MRLLTVTSGFSIHAPHEGERRKIQLIRRYSNNFQSTLPTRGSDTEIAQVNGEGGAFQSTLPTRGSDELGNTYFGTTPEFSIHAPHEGERRSISPGT